MIILAEKIKIQSEEPSPKQPNTETEDRLMVECLDNIATWFKLISLIIFLIQMFS